MRSRGKRILLIILTVIAFAFGCFAFASCDEGAKENEGGQSAQEEQGEKGDKGETGVGIQNAFVNDEGELVLTYTDGSTANLGKIIGASGEQGNQGLQGEKGENGVGIQNAYINENGELILVYTDGATVNLGKIVGASGAQGNQGSQGLGIENISFNEKNELVITLTDGTELNCGTIPACNHVYSDWEAEREASCTSVGLIKRVCEACGDTQYQFTEELGHAYGEWQNLISNCEELWQMRACPICGDTQIISAEPTADHHYTDGVCDRCGAEKPTDGAGDGETGGDLDEEEKDDGGDNSGNDSDGNSGDGQEEAVGDETDLPLEIVAPTEGLQYVFNDDLKSYCVVGIGKATETEIVIGGKYKNLPVTAVASFAFQFNSDITAVTVGDGVISVGEEAFYGCTKLTSVTIGNGVISIGNGAFGGCTAIANLRMGDGIQTIGSLAFYNCTALKSVTVPQSVKKIGQMAFFSCVNLTNIVYCGTQAEWALIQKGANWDGGAGAYVLKFKKGA